MDPVSNVDRLVLLLRQRLSERAKKAAGARASVAGAGREATVGGMAGVQALAAVEGLDDRQLKRALIQAVLADHFGSELINEAKFQLVVDNVVQTMEQDNACAALLDRTTRDLRAAAG